MLRAKEGSMINTVVNSSLIIVSLSSESGLFGPDAVSITRIPKTPNAIDA
jgi:hypothetical protein